MSAVRARIDVAVRADAHETLICAWLSLTTLSGLVLNAVLGWWWADPLAALGMLFVVSILAMLSFHLFIGPFYRLNFLLPIVTTIALATILEALGLDAPHGIVGRTVVGALHTTHARD